MEDDFSGEGNIEYLKKRQSLLKVEDTTMWEIKESLIKNNVVCRYQRDREANTGVD